MSNNIFLKQQGKALVKFDAHKPPLFEEVKNNEFVQYGYVARGDKDAKKWNNLYPDYLLYLYNRSAKNNSIINGKNKYIVGQGWSFDNISLSFEQRTSLKAFTRSLEQSKITRDLSLDRTIFGGFACEIITSNDSEKITTSHIDFSKVRQFKINTDKEGVKSELKYGYTSDWSVKNPENNEDFETLYPFTWDSNDIDNNKRYIVYYKDYRPDSKEYPLPDYIGAVPYIESDYEISNFVLNNVKNGFSGGYLVQFNNGDPTDEQKASIDAQFNNAFTGTDNAGKVLKSFNEDKESGIEITPLGANGQDDRYINLNKQIQGEIYTGHNFNPVIVGISDSNGFNNVGEEIRIASEMFQNTYADTEQRILEDFFNSVAGYNGLPERLSIIKLEVLSAQPTEQELAQILTMDERRERVGYAPLKSDFNSDKSFSFEDYFSKCGTDDSSFEFLDQQEIHALNIEDANRQADEFKKQYFASKEGLALLGLLNKGNTLPQIRNSLNVTTAELDELLSKLIDEELINTNNELTEEGKTEARQNEVFVVYKYIVRGDAPKLITESRDFCRSLVDQSKNKSWTREDINALNNGVTDLPDVFSARGGFYNNPNTGVTTPYCRHVWQQRLVRLK
tara:strand:+ start:4377 stop:6239 length:1863 start_codon:yes stop_codon:yes gene_type:complete